MHIASYACISLLSLSISLTSPYRVRQPPPPPHLQAPPFAPQAQPPVSRPPCTTPGLPCSLPQMRIPRAAAPPLGVAVPISGRRQQCRGRRAPLPDSCARCRKIPSPWMELFCPHTSLRRSILHTCTRPPLRHAQPHQVLFSIFQHLSLFVIKFNCFLAVV